MVDDDEPHPFELMAERSRKRSAPSSSSSAPAGKMKQGDIRSSFSKASPTLDEDSDDSDLEFNFNKHQKTEVKESKIRSTFEDDSKKKGERKLLATKYPRSRPALQPGWSARLYKYISTSKEVWVYSHAIHGETFGYDETKRTKDQWNEAKERRRSGGGLPTSNPAQSGSDGWRAKKRDGGHLVGGGGGSADSADGNDDVEEEEEAEPEDELAALLGKKKKQEEDVEAMKERVHEEMTQAMDTGVKANPLLQKIYGGRR